MRWLLQIPSGWNTERLHRQRAGSTLNSPVSLLTFCRFIIILSFTHIHRQWAKIAHLFYMWNLSSKRQTGRTIEYLSLVPCPARTECHRWCHPSLHSHVHSMRDKCLMLLIYCANCGVMLPCVLLLVRTMHWHFCRTYCLLLFMSFRMMAYSPVTAHELQTI